MAKRSRRAFLLVHELTTIRSLSTGIFFLANLAKFG
jgi:hypothetical protein